MLSEPSIEPSAAHCDKIQSAARTKQISNYEDFYPFYLCEHSKV